MRLSILLTIVAILAVSGCHNPTDPPTPAAAPQMGAIFTFHNVDSVNARSYDISYTIDSTIGGFKAVDSNGAGIDYKLYDNGDIGWTCSCDWLEFGVQSHRSFRTRASQTPVKYHGYGYNAWAHFESQYLGNESLTFNSRAYDCAKIEVDGMIQVDDSASTTFKGSVTTYWYSPEIKYFLRIDSKQYILDSLVGSSTSTLVSIK